MSMLHLLHARATTRIALALDSRDERGDVPGWVMITVMSVGIVAGLQRLMGPELEAMLQRALSKVT